MGIDVILGVLALFVIIWALASTSEVRKSNRDWKNRR